MYTSHQVPCTAAQVGCYNSWLILIKILIIVNDTVGNFTSLYIGLGGMEAAHLAVQWVLAWCKVHICLTW